MQRRYELAKRTLVNVYVLVDYNEINRLYPTDSSKPVWFDPLLSSTLIQRWLSNQGMLVRSWGAGQGQGVQLYKLTGERR
jgi:hypothetical protein